MALDRQRIERKDFPIGRRGYDPDAQEIRTEASRQARALSEQVTAQAREYVARVLESTQAMRQRLEAMGPS